jgi:energy-coupling factor transport system permease protein
MNRNLIIGQYRPLDSYGHRLDPRGKIFVVVCLMIFSIFTSSSIFYGLIIAGLFLLLIMSDISLATLGRNMKPFIILIAITALYHLIFSARDSETIFRLWGLRLTAGGVRMALSFSLRMLVFVGLAFFISLTTSPSDIADTLVNWLKPLRKLGVPVNDIGLIIFIAMRFIPVLTEELDTIKKAQIMRGVDFSGSLKQRARKLSALLIPVFQSAIRRADDLALAIESRGYVSGAERSSLKLYRFQSKDRAFVAIALTAAATLFAIFGKANA